ncbi:hypothetical protein SEA_CAIB_57 [Gordonia phage CaiB]|nr:hypothetical protein SEA_CAIB_57 [Gordonia phage CaiB]
MSSERGGETPTPNDHLRSLLNQHAKVTDPAEREEMIEVFTSLFVVMTREDYGRDMAAVGDWQNRARRVINAANGVFDVNVTTKQGQGLNGALVVLHSTLIANDFRLSEENR